MELAGTIAYTKGAMTNIAEKLVSLGFAERLYDETDRRTIQLQITTAGRNALKEAQTIGEDVFMQLFVNLREEEINQYLLIQEKIVKRIHSRKKI